MKTALETVNITDQDVTAGSVVNLGANQIMIGDGAIHSEGSPSIVFTRKGKYLVLFDADFTIATSGEVTFQMLFKGSPLLGGSDTVQASTAGPFGIHISKLIEIRPSCCAIDNRGAIQFQVTADGTIISAKTIVVEL